MTSTVHVRFFASARAAAGTERETLRLPHAACVRDAKVRLAELHPGKLEHVLEVASFLVNGVTQREDTTPLPEGAEVDVLPPFAGG